MLVVQKFELIEGDVVEFVSGGAPGAPSYYPTAVAMYSSDKVMNGKPLGSSISSPGSCFPGRYSPTYRGPDPMRRCVNPTVSSNF